MSTKDRATTRKPFPEESRVQKAFLAAVRYSDFKTRNLTCSSYTIFIVPAAPGLPSLERKSTSNNKRVGYTMTSLWLAGENLN